MNAPEHISLLVTSGSGPAECQQAVAHVLKAMRSEAEAEALEFDAHAERSEHGVRSAVVVVSGAAAADFARNWRGTIQWCASSRLRPSHKRANWFIGVFDLPVPAQNPDHLRAGDVVFDTFRAGGPGGQHQNTTDSAVRATHRPTGLAAVARAARSQHRNKALALARLQQLLAARTAASEADQKALRNGLHHALQRGNPVRCFKGHDFRDVTGG
ncbi:peptide chain release factor H [Ruegeria sp. HKCCC1038]|uniref:peptide chain release factor H n=1 Tax=Ruegeria sp. HKCCC1038 TaxID=2682982 RepID=UPI0014879F9E|nr:peptide chain release factor H [Ruegeria sp. HKCCC1038]